MANDFGNRLKQAIRLSGIKQRDLAEQTGLTEAAISRYISGTRSPNLNQFRKLCGTLNVSADWLMGSQEAREPIRTGMSLL